MSNPFMTVHLRDPNIEPIVENAVPVIMVRELEPLDSSDIAQVWKTEVKIDHCTVVIYFTLDKEAVPNKKGPEPVGITLE